MSFVRVKDLEKPATFFDRLKDLVRSKPAVQEDPLEEIYLLSSRSLPVLWTKTRSSACTDW